MKGESVTMIDADTFEDMPATVAARDEPASLPARADSASADVDEHIPSENPLCCIPGCETCGFDCGLRGRCGVVSSCTPCLFGIRLTDNSI